MLGDEAWRGRPEVHVEGGADGRCGRGQRRRARPPHHSRPVLVGTLAHARGSSVRAEGHLVLKGAGPPLGPSVGKDRPTWVPRLQEKTSSTPAASHPVRIDQFTATATRVVILHTYIHTCIYKYVHT